MSRKQRVLKKRYAIFCEGDTKVVQMKVGELLIQFGYSRINIVALIMENHCDDVIRRMSGIFAEIAGFVNKDAKFLQFVIPQSY